MGNENSNPDLPGDQTLDNPENSFSQKDGNKSQMKMNLNKTVISAKKSEKSGAHPVDGEKEETKRGMPNMSGGGNYLGLLMGH